MRHRSPRNSGLYINSFFVEPAWGKVRHSCYYFAKVYVCVCASIRLCLGHNSYIHGWISKLFDTVVVLQEE